MASRTSPSDDVVFYVGKHRHPYHVSADSLCRSSTYFKHLLDAAPHLRSHPILMDCEESIFESLLLLMRYGTLEALPPMSPSEMFRLKKEAECYGIRYTEPHRSSKSEESHSDDGCSDISCSSPSCSSSISGSPRSTMHMSPPHTRKHASAHGRHYEDIRAACTTAEQLTELREFPLDLADPSRLLLVSCVDQEKASIYTCDCASTRGSKDSATQWAINFHHRHAFCTACGHTPKLSPKHFAEMFMAAAANYLAQAGAPGRQAAPKKSDWRVSSDSTCILRFLRSAGDGPDACGCLAGGGRAGREALPTVWGANYFHSHAFCTGCGEVAKGPRLLSLLLAIRYGGRNVSRSSSRADSHTSSPRGRSL